MILAYLKHELKINDRVELSSYLGPQAALNPIEWDYLMKNPEFPGNSSDDDDNIGQAFIALYDRFRLPGLNEDPILRYNTVDDTLKVKEPLNADINMNRKHVEKVIETFKQFDAFPLARHIHTELRKSLDNNGLKSQNISSSEDDNSDQLL